jgi:putative FmdB family regulatory protein
MPMYCYKCPGCEHKTERFRHMSNAGAAEWCPKCGRSMEKDIAAQNVGSGNQPFQTPIEMHSIALNHPADIAAFKQRNPGVEVRDGVPVAHTRKEKKDILKTEGYVEKNGYN